MRYAIAADVPLWAYEVAFTYLCARYTDAELAAKFPGNTGLVIAVRGHLYYYDPALEAARVTAWHAAFNAALQGSLAAKRHRQDAVDEAVIAANLVHDWIPKVP
jgi:hypothetical protein